ncbi:MAG TPA: RnfABCDGE type electron transport complex subunit D [Mariprofundaceae bacterium]|nr:RnfABCDGE type electron transport complex subunit D [Mariprofundaceae bacterium]
MNMLISSPHLHSGDSVRATMITVMLALAPAVIVSVYLFGWLAVLIIASSVVGCMVLEWLSLRLMGRSTAAVGDGSAALTGLFLALILPPTTPWWMVLIGCFMAIVLTKQIYGGLGYNLFNPALAARVVLLISFPLQMTTWIVPMHVGNPVIDLYNLQDCLQVFFFGVQSLGHSIDAVSMASALGYVKTEWTRGVSVADALRGYGYNYLDAFLGREAGSLGETSALALLLGGIYLLARHTVTWHIPFSYLGTVVLLAAIFSTINPQHFAPPMFHLMAGGLMLCAFFMATDPVSSPVTPAGRLVFGTGCGILTWAIRSFGGYPEGAMFSVVLMNCTVPLIDHYFRPRIYGQGLPK